MSLENSDGLLNLALQGLVMLQHVQQLGVVDLEKHARNFSGQVGEHALDEREQALTEHLLLFLWLGSRQHGRGQRLLALDHHCLLRGRLRRHGLWHRHHLARVPHAGSVLEALRSRNLSSHRGRSRQGGLRHARPRLHHRNHLAGRVLYGHGSWVHTGLVHAGGPSGGSAATELSLHPVHHVGCAPARLLGPPVTTPNSAPSDSASLGRREETLGLDGWHKVTARGLRESHLKYGVGDKNGWKIRPAPTYL